MSQYSVNISDSNIRAPLVSLKVLYKDMPTTSGCEKCVEHNKDNAYWCCLSLNPSMYYVEFLYAWEKVQKWIEADRLQLISRCIKNYLSNNINKGCVFYNNGCSIYDERPLSCRMYGVIPKEGWEERVNMAKSRFGESYTPIPQCSLVKSSQDISKTDDDKWFNHTKNCEKRIGVKDEIIKDHDGPFGSYRTFHDHILLEIFPTSFLNLLTSIKVKNFPQNEIDSLVETVLDLYNKQDA